MSDGAGWPCSPIKPSVGIDLEPGIAVGIAKGMADGPDGVVAEGLAAMRSSKSSRREGAARRTAACTAELHRAWRSAPAKPSVAAATAASTSGDGGGSHLQLDRYG